uniref:Protein zwilch n=3 Tax=Cacopsylla melanoneura TaxID=428564 RepID=A0A8D9AMV1_9HEMI
MREDPSLCTNPIISRKMAIAGVEALQAYIHSLDPKYTLEKLSSSEILKELALVSKDIIFIYKEPLNIVLNGDYEVKTILSDVADAEQTLDGSPLPAPFSQSDLTLGEYLIGNADQTVSSKQVTKYAAVQLQHARSLLSLINTGKLVTPSSLPVFILTPGDDYQKTILLGMERDENGVITTLSANITDAFIEGNNKMFVDQMIEQHTKKSCMSPFELSSTVKSTYRIQGVTDNSHVELHLTWDTPTMEVPVSEATTELLLTCSLDCEASHGLWNDLQRLVRFIKLIQSWKSGSSDEISGDRMNAVLNPKVESNPGLQGDILTRLTQVIEEDKHTYIGETRRKKPAGVTGGVGPGGPGSDVFDVSLGQVVTQVMGGERSEDLSDKLWTILSECSTYKDLTSAFQLAFQKIRSNIQEGCKVNILSKKCSRFVSAVRNLLKGDYSNPGYWDKLEILVEMGIEKLRTDYSYVFLKVDLVYEDQLATPDGIPKFSEMSGDEWGSHMLSYVNYLTRLHTILSILLQVDDCIKLPHSALSHLTLAAFETVSLTYDQAENNDYRYQLRCPLSTLNIKKFVTGSKLFSTWSLHLSHENKKRAMSTSSLLTMNPLPIHPLQEQDNREDPDMTLARLSPFQHYRLVTNCIKLGTLSSKG